MILTASLAVAAAALQNAAPQWRPIVETPEYNLSWDAANLTREGDVATIRLRVDHVPARQGVNAYSVSRVDIRCATSESRVFDTVNYAADGTEGIRDATPLPFEPIPAGSIAVRLHELACPASPTQA